MYLLLKHLLLPPCCLLIAGVLGLACIRRPRDIGWRVAMAALLVLSLLSMPAVGGSLLNSLQNWPPMPADGLSAQGAGAIVVLGAETSIAPEYHLTDIGPLTLVRIRYAARLHVATGLPVLTSGGPASSRLGETMATVLREEFHIPVAWVESASATTWENARFSADILRRNGITKVLLVTHAWHMRRAVASFTAAGIDVIPAPTGEAMPGRHGLLEFLPSASGLRDSYFALHEYAGNAFYQLRSRLGS